MSNVLRTSTSKISQSWWRRAANATLQSCATPCGVRTFFLDGRESTVTDLKATTLNELARTSLPDRAWHHQCPPKTSSHEESNEEEANARLQEIDSVRIRLRRHPKNAERRNTGATSRPRPDARVSTKCSASSLSAACLKSHDGQMTPTTIQELAVFPFFVVPSPLQSGAVDSGSTGASRPERRQSGSECDVHAKLRPFDALGGRKPGPQWSGHPRGRQWCWDRGASRMFSLWLLPHGTPALTFSREPLPEIPASLNVDTLRDDVRICPTQHHIRKWARSAREATENSHTIVLNTRGVT